jgi:hypothetical protein
VSARRDDRSTPDMLTGSGSNKLSLENLVCRRNYIGSASTKYADINKGRTVQASVVRLDMCFLDYTVLHD